jgi:hypothetical protein
MTWAGKNMPLTGDIRERLLDGLRRPGHWRHDPDSSLAAILAADVAGYSRLIGADEEGTSTG